MKIICYTCEREFEYNGVKTSDGIILCNTCAPHMFTPGRLGVVYDDWYQKRAQKFGGALFRGWDKCIESLKSEMKSQEITPGQVCLDCKLPAPHAMPNHEDKYVCVSCKVIGEL